MFSSNKKSLTELLLLLPPLLNLFLLFADL